MIKDEWVFNPLNYGFKQVFKGDKIYFIKEKRAVNEAVLETFKMSTKEREVNKNWFFEVKDRIRNTTSSCLYPKLNKPYIESELLKYGVIDKNYKDNLEALTGKKFDDIKIENVVAPAGKTIWVENDITNKFFPSEVKEQDNPIFTGNYLTPGIWQTYIAKDKKEGEEPFIKVIKSVGKNERDYIEKHYGNFYSKEPLNKEEVKKLIDEVNKISSLDEKYKSYDHIVEVKIPKPAMPYKNEVLDLVQKVDYFKSLIDSDIERTKRILTNQITPIHEKFDKAGYFEHFQNIQVAINFGKHDFIHELIISIEKNRFTFNNLSPRKYFQSIKDNYCNLVSEKQFYQANCLSYSMNLLQKYKLEVTFKRSLKRLVDKFIGKEALCHLDDVLSKDRNQWLGVNRF